MIMEQEIKKCAFTGHRILDGDFDLNLLERVILRLIKGGVKQFYCGMAVGFDLKAAECVLKIKKSQDIKLIACIPCKGQSGKYSLNDKNRYFSILEKCDEKIVLSKNYYAGCMFARNRYMVDNCNVLVCYLRENSGGTYYTVNYAKKRGIKVIEI